MATPDKNQPKKHFFKVPDELEEQSQAEKDAFYDLIVDTLLGQEAATKVVEKAHKKAKPERE